MTIHIQNLKFQAIIGILEHERELSQDVLVDATISYSYNESFIDYALLAELIKTHIQTQKFLLIEDALQSTISLLTAKHKEIDEIYLKITKPTILNECIVGVSHKYSKVS